MNDGISGCFLLQHGAAEESCARMVRERLGELKLQLPGGAQKPAGSHLALKNGISMGQKTVLVLTRSHMIWQGLFH